MPKRTTRTRRRRAPSPERQATTPAQRAAGKAKALGRQVLTRAKGAGSRLAAKVKQMDRKKVARAAAVAAGLGAAAIGAVVARRKAKKRKRFKLLK